MFMVIMAYHGIEENNNSFRNSLKPLILKSILPHLPAYFHWSRWWIEGPSIQ